MIQKTDGLATEMVIKTEFHEYFQNLESKQNDFSAKKRHKEVHKITVDHCNDLGTSTKGSL